MSALKLDSRSAADRAAAVAAELAEIDKRQAKDFAALDRERASILTNAQRDADAITTKAKAAHAVLEKELLDSLRSAIDPLIAAHRVQPTRANARALGELLIATTSRCRDELGVEFAATLHLVLAFVRALVAERPNAVFVFGSKDGGLWSELYPAVERANCVVKAAADPVLVLAGLEPLEHMLTHRAANAPSDGWGYEVGRLALAEKFADYGSYAQAATAFDREWDAAYQKRQFDAYKAQIARARAYRRGEDVGEVDVDTERHYRAMDESLVGPMIRGLSRVAALALKRAIGDHSSLVEDFDKSIT